MHANQNRNSIAFAMIIKVLQDGDSNNFQLRLHQLELPASCSADLQIKELGHGSSELIYLVGFTLTHSDEWPALRVRLAHSNRFYIVVGEELITADIVNAMRDGAYDVLSLEDPDERWKLSVAKVAEAQELWLQLYGGQPIQTEAILIGESAAIKSLQQAVKRLGPTDATVLITGESGVGKERVAQALHEASGRKPFIALNCAAIPRELMEAELFGAEKGAYTGALKSRHGMVQQADGGTLFLDEVGEMDIAMQPKLLRFLETRSARSVGGQQEYPVNVRILSATNRNLEQDMAKDLFRQDLYYRLSEISLLVPPLRSRPSDIPHFARFFLQAASERFGKHFDRLEPELVRHFQQHRWTGNVRELKSTIDRLVILHDGPMLRASWWVRPEEKLSDPEPVTPQSLTASAPATQQTALPNARQKHEMAGQLLRESNQNLGWVAARLGIHPTTLYRWRKQGKV